MIDIVSADHNQYNHNQTNVSHDDNKYNGYWNNNSFNISRHLSKLKYELEISGEITGSKQNNIYETCKNKMIEEFGINNYNITKRIWSQAWQDWILYHNFFYGKTNGVYIDIGAYSPFFLSNTAFFDICMGWKGICVEPTDRSSLFNNTRSCNVAKHCAWSETKKLSLNSKGTLSAVIHETYDKEKYKNDPNVFECDAISGDDLFKQYKARNKYNQIVDLSNMHEIDLISLDIEGSETEFLKCFPFNKYNVKVWTIEINKPRNKIDQIMYFNGYNKVDFMEWGPGDPLDAIFVKMRDKRLKRPYQWPQKPACA